MDEKQKLIQDLTKAAEQSKNRPLSAKENAQIAELAENWLLLLDDTEE